MTLRMSEEEFREWMRKRGSGSAARGPEATARAAVEAPVRTVPPPAGETQKRSKYGNRRTEVDGIRFDSKHEAGVYAELMARVKAGELQCVLRQVRFDLPGGIRYVADFVAIAPGMRIEGVYDAKSPATKQNRVYINKKKQMKACWGIEIREV